jgi:cytochrome c553
MLRSIRRRLSRVEEFLPIPITAERFYARAQQHARRTGGSVGSAIETLAKNLSDSDLDSISAEFEQIAFGSDTTARDAAKREVFAAAGYSDWNPPAEESKDEGW